MSVLIKGMEMPTGHGVKCICIFPDGKVANIYDSDKKQIATAVPVPPHGRLIDADKLCLSSGFSTATEYGRGRSDQIEAIKSNAPTIIPAEEEPAKDINVPGTYDILYEEGGPDTR